MDRSASEADIKKAYRVSYGASGIADDQKLSKKYHPDLNPEKEAHDKFIELSRGEFCPISSSW